MNSFRKLNRLPALFLMSILPGLSMQALAQTTSDDSNSQLDGIAAIVNNDIITFNELNEEVLFHKVQLRQQRTALPDVEALQKQVLERLILSRIQLQSAKRRNITVNDENLNSALERIAQQNKMDLYKLREALQADGIDYTKFRERRRSEIIINRLQQRQVFNRIKVTQQEVDNFLDNQNLQGSGDLEFRLQHILVVTPEAATAKQINKAKSKAQDILKQVKQGKDFAQLAIAHSNGQQALNGGDLGWRKLAQLPTLFADITVKLKQGDASDLIRSPSGFHIIRLAEKRSNEPQHIINQTKARHILIQVNEFFSNEEALQRAKLLKQRIDSGEKFDKLAIVHSQDKGSAVQGGELGWINPGQMVKPFEQAVDVLQPGELSEPVRTQFGWHLVQVLDRRKHDDTETFKMNRVRQFIRQRKLQPALQNWLRRIRDESFVEIRI